MSLQNSGGAMAAEATAASDLIVYVYPTRVTVRVLWMLDQGTENRKAEAPVTEVNLLQDDGCSPGYKVVGYEMGTNARLDLGDWLFEISDEEVGLHHPKGKPFYWYLVEDLERDEDVPDEAREALRAAPEMDWWPDSVCEEGDRPARDPGAGGAAAEERAPITLPAYNPGASESYAGAVADFVAGPVVDDVQTVPGITKAGARILRKAGVETTFQLLGKGLDCRTEGGDTRTTCDAFYRWLKEAGINSHRNTVVRGVMEKLNTMMDGMYNEEEL